MGNNTKIIHAFMQRIYYILIIVTMILISRCSSYKKNTSLSLNQNKFLTIAQEDLLNAQFYFYRHSDTSTTLYSLIDTHSLLFSRLDTGMQFYAAVKFSVYLYSINKNILTDSITKNFYIPQSQNTFSASINIPTSYDNYNAKIYITDLNKKTRYSYYTELKIHNDNARNNFLIVHKSNLLFKPYAIEQSTLKIYHRKKTSILYVDVFKYNHTPAPPPFSNTYAPINYLPDSSFTLNPINNEYYEFKVAPYKYYHIRIHQNQVDGLTIFSIDSIFPNIKDAQEMLYTTRYIMNKNEYERCVNNSINQETKKCIDNFWIQIAGSKERAKELIKNYYKRVMDANKLFTSYKYGWQTDRGMIYIIFGPPEKIQKSMSSEKWYYSLNNQKNALIFNFNKNKTNPFTNSDFVLERNEYYKDIWYLTIDKIRQGRLIIK